MVQMEPGGATLSGIAGTADVTSASSLARSTAGGNFSMIDIRPSYWTLPFIKMEPMREKFWTILAGQTIPRDRRPRNGELIETADSWRKIRKTKVNLLP